MVDVQNYTWEQGEDGEVSMIYKIRAAENEEALPVDLTGYSLRMDIATLTGEWIWTFNSDDIVEVPSVDDAGDADNEATLGSDGLIYIVVPRTLSLPDGKIYLEMQEGNIVFNYDVFLRSPEDKQKKILKGQITMNTSVTQWL